MLKKLVTFEGRVSLVANSGIQMLDFGISLDPRKLPMGEFVRQVSGQSLARLLYDEEKAIHTVPTARSTPVRSTLSVPVDQSLALFDKTWLPLPFFERRRDGSFETGPTNWARMRIVDLAPGADSEGNTHRVILAFDTRIEGDAEGINYVAPTRERIARGADFKIAHEPQEMGFFLETTWIDAWLRKEFSHAAERVLKLDQESREEELEELHHQAHYLNLLWILADKVGPPSIEIKLVDQRTEEAVIPVDLVLDVGNSRTCGVLIEQHAQSSDGLKSRYELELRDLAAPENVYTRPFESRVEFSKANFGDEKISFASGSPNAFLWPTIARVGPEATRLAGHRHGTEGSTGLSSPKRYLWDEARFTAGWRFNNAFEREDQELLATAAPFTLYIDELGKPLYYLTNSNDRMPVYRPHYSRSSLMMFMLAEVLCQGIVQINSSAQRLKQSLSNTPRQLRSIILTVPPSMPKPEREIFRTRVQEAVYLLWKAFGWHDADADPSDESALTGPPFPTINVEWDEASCGQVVYLFSEIQNNFGGHPDEFFAVARRPRPHSSDKALTVASIDIGGGTTDLVIVDYELDDGRGANVYIRPNQRFRDGFKVAGDDILLNVIQEMLIPPLAQALREHGVGDPGPMLSRLVGAEAVDIREATLRQQFALQVLFPAGLRLLREYEAFDPTRAGPPIIMTFGELLRDRHPSADVLTYLPDALRRELGPREGPIDLLSVQVPVDLRRLHGQFLRDKFDISRTIRALGEIVHLYQCDVLLLTGRPSRLPGVQSLLRMLVPLPPNRIVPLHNYRTGVWYPFHKQGMIDDPKTTAAVGAVLCVLGRGRLPNFFFRSDGFTPYSTVRYLGMMDDQGTIKAEDIFYEDVNLDDPYYDFGERAFEMRGMMRIGFRQLAAERWGAAPLYTLSFADDQVRDDLYREGGVLKVRLKSDSRGRNGTNDRLAIAGVESDTSAVNPKAIKLSLNTLANVGVGESSYWLDSGSVYR